MGVLRSWRDWLPELPGYALAGALGVAALTGIAAGMVTLVQHGYWWLLPVAALLLVPVTLAWLNRADWL